MFAKYSILNYELHPWFMINGNAVFQFPQVDLHDSFDEPWSFNPVFQVRSHRSKFATHLGIPYALICEASDISYYFQVAQNAYSKLPSFAELELQEVGAYSISGSSENVSREDRRSTKPVSDVEMVDNAKS